MLMKVVLVLIITNLVSAFIAFLLFHNRKQILEENEALKITIKKYQETIKKHEELLLKLKEVKKKKEEKIDEVQNTNSDDLNAIADLLNGM